MSNEDEDNISMPCFNKNDKVWIETGKHSEEMWQEAKVVEQSGVFVLCMTDSGRAINLDLRDDSCFSVNPSSQPDMTGLYFINEPGILFNLEDRSLKDKPYTFMGNVLVAVNPLKRINDPEVKSLLNVPHPFTVSQNAFSQLKFAFENKQSDVNQSVVTSGESGAGKTECCKMVLKYLVENIDSGGSNIDERLLESNHITEAFGNAQTLRNHNSSRFGKFMKLHFERKKKEWEIIGASVETYLLERSRVSLHNEGERNFHIFYQFRAGIDSLPSNFSEIKQSFAVAEKNLCFRLMSPLSKSEEVSNPKGYKNEKKKSDKEDFVAVLKAMKKLKVKEEAIDETFMVLAGIMHLGNFLFKDQVIKNTDTAVLDEENLKGYNPVTYAAKYLGVKEEVLLNLVTREELVIRKQKVVRVFDKFKACFTRDAITKSLYSVLFDSVISNIDTALTLKRPTDVDDSIPFIGILDIFGFESFKRNDFEQLLINFANEALQATFNRSVFENEAALYKKERLILDDSDMIRAPSNSACMTLFVGNKSQQKKKKKSKLGSKESLEEFAKKRGLLLAIDDESQGLEPSDKKMLANLHRMFGKHPDWKRPHPKQRQEVFIIKHFAGEVKYTIGYFLEKNQDQLPKSIVSVFSNSTKSLLSSAFSKNKNMSKSRTIIKKFRTQISDLVDTLEETKCSFIRCVKPNEDMKRGKSSSWFNRRYISHQLRNLSIPQTAEVLQNGFPTRLTYSSLMDDYLKLIPKDALKGWKKLLDKSKKNARSSSNFRESSFVKSLLFAFEVDSKSYKLGLTMVFFKSGELAKLDQILKSAANFNSFKDKARVVKRFRYYFVRLRWREVVAKVIACNKFIALLEELRERERIRLEQERLERERKEKEAAAKAAKLKSEEEAEQKRLDQLEKKRLEDEEIILKQLEEERIRREMKVDLEVKDKQQEKIANLYDDLEDQAEDQVKERFKNRGKSLTEHEIDEASKAAMLELQNGAAKMEAQNQMEENLTKFYTDLVDNSSEFWTQATEGIKESLKGWKEYFQQIRESETMQNVKRRHKKRMVVLKRTVKVTNRLLLRAARKSEWFKDAEEKLGKVQEKIAKEWEKERMREEGMEVEDESKIHRIELENAPKVVSRKRNRRKTRGSAVTRRSSVKSYKRVNGGMRAKLEIDRKEAQTGKASAMEHIEKVKEMIEKGEIPPSALGDLATMMEKSVKVRVKVNGQHIPQNEIKAEDLMEIFSSDFPEVNPSDDKKNRWCKAPLAFDKGFFFINTVPLVTRSKKIQLLCAWEHGHPKKKNRLYSHWDVELSVSSFALIYDALLSSTDKKLQYLLKSTTETIPEFPGWKSEFYKKNIKQRKASKGGARFFGPSLIQTRGERVKFLSQCVDTKVVLKDPSLLGDWLAELFHILNAKDSKTGHALLLQVPLIVELFDVDTYGGVANL